MTLETNAQNEEENLRTRDKHAIQTEFQVKKPLQSYHKARA
jgi:hypothetical protein